MRPLNPGERVILKLLQDEGPMTAHEIAEATGMGYKTLYGAKTIYLRFMRDNRLIYVSEYKRQSRHGGPPIPVFAAGGKPDADRPTPKTNAERSAGWQRNRKARRADKSIVAILLGTKKAPVVKSKKSDLSIFLGV